MRPEVAEVLRAKRLAWLALRGPTGATASEFGQKFDLGPQASRRALEALAERGLARRSVLRRDNLLGGGRQVVWVATGTESMYPPREAA